MLTGLDATSVGCEHRELAALARDRGVLVHCDAAEAAGRISLDVSQLGVDMLTVVGHKMYAPKGAAALYVRDGVGLEPVVYGGGQEHGPAGRTENVALGAAADLAAGLAGGEPERIARLHDQIHMRLTEALPARVHLNGPLAGRLPNMLKFSIDGCHGHQLLQAVPGCLHWLGVRRRHPQSLTGTDRDGPEPRALSALRLSWAD